MGTGDYSLALVSRLAPRRSQPTAQGSGKIFEIVVERVCLSLEP
jgi:hypothetical protein